MQGITVTAPHTTRTPIKALLHVGHGTPTGGA